MLTPTHAEIVAIAPEIILTITASLVLIIEAFLPRLRRYLSGLTMLAIAGAIWARLSLELPGAVWAGMLRIDQLTAFVDTYILIAAFFAVWMAGPFMRRTAAECGEFYALILFATVGSMVMACSVNLLTIFLGLELLSIPLYVLNAFLQAPRGQCRGGAQVLRGRRICLGFCRLRHGSTLRWVGEHESGRNRPPGRRARLPRIL